MSDDRGKTSEAPTGARAQEFCADCGHHESLHQALFHGCGASVPHPYGGGVSECRCKKFVTSPDRQFAVHQKRGGGIEMLTSDIGVGHDRDGVHLLLHGKIVATVHEDEADLIGKVLPWHAEQVRRLRSSEPQVREETP